MCIRDRDRDAANKDDLHTVNIKIAGVEMEDGNEIAPTTAFTVDVNKRCV